MSYKSWVESNPLRLWRLVTGTALVEVAAKIGASTSAVQKWESGGGRPSDENMDKLTRLTGIDGLVQDWDEWERKRE